MVAGIGAYEASPAEAEKQFSAAATIASSANPINAQYLPRLVEAAVKHHAGDAAGTLSTIDDVLTDGKEARTCGAPHEVNALLPVKAWTAERLGRHAESDTALDTYLKSTETFSGHGQLRCRLASYRPSFLLTLNAEQELRQLFFRGEKSSGTLQAGVGFSVPRNEDRLVCMAHPILGKRVDVQLNTYLMKVVYAFRAGEEDSAHQALQNAVSLARRLRLGDDVTVGFGEKLTLDIANKEMELAPVAWASAVVRA